MKQTKQSLAVEMQCTGCEEIINSAVIKLDGVDKVKADFANSTVEVIFDTNKIAQKQIIQTIADSGYKAELKKQKNS